MMAGKPILYAIASGNDPVSDANCGISILPENPVELTQAVCKLLTLSSSELQAMGARGINYCLQNHDYRNLALKFLNSVI